jgi:hypothetical protein
VTTQPIAAYSFLPWARQGLGIYIREGDQDHAVSVRGSIDVSLQLTGQRIGGGSATETIPRAVQLYGPGDIIGIDPRIIVRTEPRNWITNFETNYLPFIEFYEEDFPWRYTPAKESPNEKRLRPWLALLVLAEGEFAEGANVFGRPLPFIDVADPGSTLPPFDQLWAWAHVHVNGGLGSYSDGNTALAQKLDSALRADRDVAYSRLLSPRILQANTAYHAFLVPSFETGRLAGLGEDPGEAGFATQGAWESYAGKKDATFFPFYHRWYFRTSSVGDFEYLVRILQPRTVDPRVGRRDMDVLDPGPNLDLPAIPELGGVLRLGGALRAPLDTLSDEDLQEYERFERWGEPYPHAFQTALAALANLAADYGDEQPLDANNNTGLPLVSGDEDPWIVPPIYGRWHARVQRLAAAEADPGLKRWVQELNLDPRHRTASGFGTQVVQKNQEDYMEAAWQQVGKVLEGNRKIRYGQFAKLTSQVWHGRELAVLQQRAPERFLSITAPVQRRVLAEGLTVHYQAQRSTLPLALTSKTVRQALRPAGRIARLGGFDANRSPANLLARVNLGEVSAAPPKVISPNLPSEDQIRGQLEPKGLPRPWLELLLQNPWLRYLPLALALLLILFLFILTPLLGGLAGVIVGAVLLGGAVWLYYRLDRILRRARAVREFFSGARTPASVDRLPASPDFRLGVPGKDPAPAPGASDSAEATRFKGALRNLYTVDSAEREIPLLVRQPLALEAVAQATIAGLHPTRTIQPRVLGSIFIPDRIRGQLLDPFGEVMVYPEIDLPMYEPLRDLSGEYFVPNLQRIENNSITLLETNQKFIEAYLVGLNHEFSRELLWREYPTDQRGSYFRQFWDVRDFLAEAGADPQALRERLFDIPELHTWRTDSGLGDHDHREAQGEKEDELVLVIRGELLKKYPTAVIYAHRADWELLNGEPDKSRPRKLYPLTAAQEADPPREIVKTPLYEAKVDPDIYFFGFDLTADQARGGEIVDGKEDPGWFFVIKERPGEPRFGLDLPRNAPQSSINTWNDLAWTDVLANFEASAFLRTGEKSVTLTNPNSSGGLQDQYNEDSRFQWRADTHAAELAYILYQVPVMMAVHAAEMLVKPE